MKDRKQQEKRRQAKIQKRKKVRKQYVKTFSPHSVVTPSFDLFDGVDENSFDLPIDLPTFLAYGANYLASPYAEGLWTPVWDVDGLAEGPGAPKRDALFALVCEKFFDKETEKFHGIGTTLGAWAMAPTKTVIGLLAVYLTHMEREHPDLDPVTEFTRSASGPVWGFFHNQIMNRLAPSESEVKNEEIANTGSLADAEDGACGSSAEAV